MLTARRFVAVLFLLLFSACLIAVIVAVQVIGKVADPGYVPSRLRDADAYDFLYDDVMGAVLSDRIDRGLRYEIALAGGAPVVVRFDDTEAAKRAVRGLVEGVVPREFLQDRVETILIGTLSYMYGRSDQFELDPKLPDMVRRVPQAVRVAAGEIRLGETLSR
ncbi:MAG: hypothetical protein FJ313_01940, partial [Gemmatimonadetes bacterium]|nr:hypothetical protein [Gemmatimonadota bacterium]